MKDIIYYIRKSQNHLISQVNDAAIIGLRNVGVEFEIKYEDDYEPSEIAILFGFHKNVNAGGRIRKIIYDEQGKLDKRLMVLERGFIKRDEYHSIGWDGVNGRANFNNINRPNDRLKLLNIDIKPWRTDGSKVLICGQVPWDSNLQHLNDGSKKGIDSVRGYLNWLGGLATQLVEYEGNTREVVFRPHPLFKRKDYYKEVIPEQVRWSEIDFQEDLKDAWACFAFNSNSVVEALIEGVHGFAFDQGSVAFQHANKRLKFLKKPHKFDREQWLSEVAYAQWNLEEISQGLFWKALNEKR